MRTDYEELKETGMIGAYYPEYAVEHKGEEGVVTNFRDCVYRITDDSFTRERTMMVNGKIYFITSVFSTEPTATPTQKLLSYIDSELAKDTKSA